MNIPIIYIVYNRISIVKKTFKQILKYSNNSIIVIADGPRNDKDVIVCKKIKKYILSFKNNKKIYYYENKKNLGLKLNIINGLTKVFKKYKAAIILEDDCYIQKSFFEFSKKTLNYHLSDKNVFAITGQSFQNINKNDYYFTKYAHCWGWGTWADRWKKFIKFYSSPLKKKKINLDNKIFFNNLEKLYWEYIFKESLQNKLVSWNYIWQYFIWKKHGHVVTPYNNLVQNIGFGNKATNTKQKIYMKKVKNITINNKNSNILLDKKKDFHTFNTVYFSTIFFLKKYPISLVIFLFKYPAILLKKIKMIVLRVLKIY